MKRPFAIDPTEYPFTDRWLPYRDGYIHYLDEGQGQPVLLLHGNPTWSYLYRNVIKELRGEFRLIAQITPDSVCRKHLTATALRRKSNQKPFMI
ncbi:hypothetical protein [Brevibacillus migulae]|uniref:hypothetical protein n=1 Tax=Brevibacillus migulae TaxID=1644114 RepID=UPI001F356DE1|nr:hypothetical protein [Brevibacillus migulae]